MLLNCFYNLNNILLLVGIGLLQEKITLKSQCLCAVKVLSFSQTPFISDVVILLGGSPLSRNAGTQVLSISWLCFILALRSPQHYTAITQQKKQEFIEEHAKQFSAWKWSVPLLFPFCWSEPVMEAFLKAKDLGNALFLCPSKK